MNIQMISFACLMNVLENIKKKEEQRMIKFSSRL